MAHEGHDDHDHHHHHPADEHRASAPTSVGVWVITCSDSRGPSEDQGGPLARERLERAGHSVVGSALVRDEPSAIRQAMQHAKEQGVRAIILTGGTGLSSRDVTVETVQPLFQRTIDGFGELFRMRSFAKIGSAAMASRAVAGVWEGVVVFALPGSPHAVALALDELIVPELGHLVREVSR